MWTGPLLATALNRPAWSALLQPRRGHLLELPPPPGMPTLNHGVMEMSYTKHYSSGGSGGGGHGQGPGAAAGAAGAVGIAGGVAAAGTGGSEDVDITFTATASQSGSLLIGGRAQRGGGGGGMLGPWGGVAAYTGLGLGAREGSPEVSDVWQRHSSGCHCSHRGTSCFARPGVHWHHHVHPPTFTQRSLVQVLVQVLHAVAARRCPHPSHS